MEFNEFREKVKVALPDFLTDDLRNAEIKDTAVNKLQGESYSGISITPEGSRVGVSINLEDAFLDYQTGSQFTAVMNRLADTIVGTLGERNQFDLGFLADYSAVKNMLTVEVVGKDQNAEMLQSVPHQEMEDLAAVYRIDLGVTENGNASVLITNEMLRNYGLTPDHLHQDALDAAQHTMKYSIEQGRASIFVNKELQRVNRDALEKLDDKGVIMKFPAALSSTSTRLVLKEPKTKTSIRKVFLPKTVAEMLIARKKEIEELKELFGSEFTDYQLVFCSTNGRPMEGQVINRALNKLIQEHDLPKIVFHSLRHSSITYKLKLNGGDMKSVQGDSGHAQAKMVADVYSHIIDEDRMMNAQRFEETFYTPKKENEGKEQENAADSAQESDQELLMKLLAKPEMAALLKTLAKGL